MSEATLRAELAAVTLERDRLHALVNTPELKDFVAAVVLEAAHQRETQSDGWKGDADFFWLIGYLAGKALHNPPKHDMPSLHARLHRIITIAAAAANWHAAVLKQLPQEADRV